MASRITIYGNPAAPDVRRLQREMNVLYVEFETADPRKDARAAHRLQTELGGDPFTLPLVEVLRADDQGSVFLANPDAATLRQCLHSEDILSITSYWL
jgi:hypothetical protein